MTESNENVKSDTLSDGRTIIMCPNCNDWEYEPDIKWHRCHDDLVTGVRDQLAELITHCDSLSDEQLGDLRRELIGYISASDAWPIGRVDIDRKRTALIAKMVALKVA